MSPNVIQTIQTNYQSKMLAIITSVYCFIIATNTILKETFVCKYLVESFLMGRTSATGILLVKAEFCDAYTYLRHLPILLFDLM
jgi:hypothetical protein